MAAHSAVAIRQHQCRQPNPSQRPSLVRSYRAHGLRKAALRALAHGCATGAELMAVSAHSSLQQVQEYIDEVDQERAADAATTKLANSERT